MTALEVDNPPTVPPSRFGVFAALLRAIRRNRLLRARQRTLIMLSGYDAHMLRDMGIDPRDVAEALSQRFPLSPLFNPIRRPPTEVGPHASSRSPAN